MSAANRAEARRKAILSRGNDRLAKLATSARGEDGSGYMHQGLSQTSLSTSTFVGEETNDPQPASQGPRPSPFVGPAPSSVPTDEQARVSTQLDPDPFALISSSTQPLKHVEDITHDQSRPISAFQKIRPLIHLVTVWLLLAFYLRPPLDGHNVVSSGDRWKQWAELCDGTPDHGRWEMGTMTFLRAFLTLEILLHSISIIAGLDTVEPPLLISLVLPYLPPPFPSIIIHALKYIELGRALLDDVAGLLFGIGLIVWISRFFIASS